MWTRKCSILAWKPFPLAPGELEVTFAGGGGLNVEREGEPAELVADELVADELVADELVPVVTVVPVAAAPVAGASPAPQASSAATVVALARRGIRPVRLVRVVRARFTSVRTQHPARNLRSVDDGSELSIVLPMKRTWPRTALLAVLGVAALVGLVFLLDAVSAHAYYPDSDGATVLLEGHAMATGHPLLEGWRLSLDSFWSVDALWYLVGVAFAGITPSLLHVIPAVIAAGIIGLGVVMAVEERRGAAAVASAGTVLALLAFPSQALALFLLRGPWHVGTALWCLVAFYCLRKGRIDWRWGIAVLFLVAGMLGDLQTAALGLVPIALAGIAAAGRTRNWRAGIPNVTASAAAAALWEIGKHVTRAIGTFSMAHANQISSPHQMLRNVRHGFHELILMMGVGTSYFGIGSEPVGLSYVHVLAILVVLAAVAGTVWAIVWGTSTGRETVVGTSTEAAWRLDDMLIFGVFASPAAYTLLAINPDPAYSRYLTAGIIFAVILTGRIVGRVTEDIDWRTFRRVCAAVGLAAAGCYLAGTVINIDRPGPVNPASLLATWLESHHLHYGIGAYWSSSITTVESSNKVVIRPVICPPGKKTLFEYERNSAGYWYHEPFDFLVFQRGALWGGVDRKSAIKTYGRPAHIYVEYGYTVLVWHKRLDVRVQPVQG